MRKAMMQIAAGAILAMAQPAAAAPVSDRLMAALGGRLFPSLMTVTAPAKDSRGQDGVAAMLAARRARIAACGEDAQCVITAALWSDAERTRMADFASHPPAGTPAPTTPSDDGVRAEVLRELAGLNNILKVYGLHAAPRYPEIDGPNDAEGVRRAHADILTAVALMQAGAEDPVTALDPSVGLALALLDANGRDDAAGFEPLDATYNAGAIARAKTIDWTKYRFTAIVVTGVGPDDLETPLSALGKLNVRMAAKRYADGIAPFIIVTGGMVHPRGTRHAEAIEMRRALIERYGVPADAIVVEPYARHTTTNLRNVTRRLIALGAPLDREAVISTNAYQSAYIEGPVFRTRNQEELGYQPGRIGTRLSPQELTFLPSIASTRVDPMDPLDP